MGDSAERSRALDEASRWFTDLKRPSITTQALYDFREWRKDPENAAAFEEIERTWKAAGALGDRPAIREATETALRARPPRLEPVVARVRWAPLGTALASLVAIAAAGLFAWERHWPTYETAVGEQRLAVLSDGSRVRLDTDSEIQVRFDGAERRIRLVRGQAYFQAAHDAAHPFVVEAGGAEVRALGTRFDVRRSDGTVQVTLVEGRVQVRDAARGQSAVLAPNQALTASAAGLTAPRAVDGDAALGWTTGRITFRGVPLAAAVAEMNRYSRRKVVLEGEGASGGEAFSGGFEAGDVQGFVQALQASAGLRVVAASDREIRLAPKSGGGA